MPATQSRYWMLTFYRFSSLEEKSWQEPPLTYFVGQHEICPKTGRHHFQAYAEFSKKVSMKAIKDHFNDNTIHLERRMGKQEDAIKYCTKEESRHPDLEGITWGEPVHTEQGKRNDIHVACDKIKAGSKLHEIADEFPVQFVKYHKGFAALKHHLDPPKLRETPSVLYIQAESGKGKSTFVKERILPHWEDDYFFADDSKEGWFDGYRGEKMIIFDNFAGFYPLQRLLRMIDSQPMQLPVKGGYVALKATHFVFTSVIPYDVIYGGPHQAEFSRRVKDFGQVPPTPEELAACVEETCRYPEVAV